MKGASRWLEARASSGDDVVAKAYAQGSGIVADEGRHLGDGRAVGSGGVGRQRLEFRGRSGGVQAALVAEFGNHGVHAFQNGLGQGDFARLGADILLVHGTGAIHQNDEVVDFLHEFFRSDGRRSGKRDQQKAQNHNLRQFHAISPMG